MTLCQTPHRRATRRPERRVARRTGSLVPGMVLHMANNLLDVCLLLHP